MKHRVILGLLLYCTAACDAVPYENADAAEVTSSGFAIPAPSSREGPKWTEWTVELDATTNEVLLEWGGVGIGDEMGGCTSVG